MTDNVKALVGMQTDEPLHDHIEALLCETEQFDTDMLGGDRCSRLARKPEHCTLACLTRMSNRANRIIKLVRDAEGEVLRERVAEMCELVIYNCDMLDDSWPLELAEDIIKLVRDAEGEVLWEGTGEVTEAGPVTVIAADDPRDLSPLLSQLVRITVRRATQ